jgi:hypothetical protein
MQHKETLMPVTMPRTIARAFRPGRTVSLEDAIAVAVQQHKSVTTHERWPFGSTAPDDVTLREQCEWDDARFIRHFFPAMATEPFNPMHLDFFAERQSRHGSRGHRDATASPRGSAKTSVKGKAAIIKDIVYRHERYVAICSANDDLARDKVKDIRDEFDTNAELIRVYGPMRTRDWRMSDFITANQCRVRAFTPRTKVRGFLWNNLRPTKIVLDDAEDPETCLTLLRRERFVQWYNNDVTKLGTADTNYEIIGTILHPESLLAQLLQNPGYQHRFYQAVLHFAEGPDAWGLWSRWRTILCDLDNENRLSDALDFFHAHEATMLHGVRVLWPERKSESYYALMLDRVIHGESAFWQERQNSPTKDSTYLFDVDAIGRITVEPDGILREDGRYVRWMDMRAIIAFYDPTPGDMPQNKDIALLSKRDFAACPVLMQDRHGYSYVIDSYCEQTDDSDAQMDAIVDMCWKWQVEKLGIETNAFQATLVKSFTEKFAAEATRRGRQWSPMLVPIKQTRNKVLRIRTLQPPLTNRWLWLSDKLPARAWHELSDFTVLAGKNNRDDWLDAVQAGLTMLSTQNV